MRIVLCRATAARSLRNPRRWKHDSGWQGAPRDRVTVASECAELLIAEVDGESHGVAGAELVEESLTRPGHCGWIYVVDGAHLYST